MVFMQAEAGAQTINEAVAQPVEATSTNAAEVVEVTEETAAEEGKSSSGAFSFLGSPMFMFIIIIAIMYFLMIRPQRKRQKEIENFRNSLQPGMEVVTSGGLYGKIKEINGNIVVVEIAHNVNVRVDISVVFANPGAMQQEGK
jgi:preprotein translocase subunit YajC